mmetsp:Transcript_39668/g.88779  ORF Transcript_39668/g.88779 Transcript_39668/m.88779 type:complete len:303 (+) Transcript_39668:403-1311(+)
MRPKAARPGAPHLRRLRRTRLRKTRRRVAVPAAASFSLRWLGTERKGSPKKYGSPLPAAETSFPPSFLPPSWLRPPLFAASRSPPLGLSSGARASSRATFPPSILPPWSPSCSPRRFRPAWPVRGLPASRATPRARAHRPPALRAPAPRGLPPGPLGLHAAGLASCSSRCSASGAAAGPPSRRRRLPGLLPGNCPQTPRTRMRPDHWRGRADRARPTPAQSPLPAPPPCRLGCPRWRSVRRCSAARRVTQGRAAPLPGMRRGEIWLRFGPPARRIRRRALALPCALPRAEAPPLAESRKCPS